MHVKNKQANKQKKQQSNKQCVWTFKNMGGGWVAGWLLGGLDDKFAEPPPHNFFSFTKSFRFIQLSEWSYSISVERVNQVNTVWFNLQWFQYNHVNILREILENDMLKFFF